MAVENDRRRFQRLKLARPILATVNGQSALILDIGIGGAFVEHYGPAKVGEHVTLTFRWQGAEVSLSADVNRTSKVEGTPPGPKARASQSGLEFTDVSPEMRLKVQDMMATFVGRVLAAQRANAAPDAGQSGAILYQLGQARRLRTHGYLTYRFDGDAWTVEHSDSPVQPVNGFTVGAYEDEEELETLCRAYESADSHGRTLIRLVAELSANAARP